MNDKVPMIPCENLGELLFFQVDGEGPKLEVRLHNESVWLSLSQLAELLQVDKSGISRHLKNIFSSGELQRDSVVAIFATTAADGKTYQVEYFNLDAIISVGYRVNSLRGTQFRMWATERLKEYIVKGFTMDDARLKEAGNSRYFEELLARIRDIRSSEKIFWRKILDIYATSVDYNPQAPESQLFFKQVQNKMHWAAHGHTAAELIYARVDATKPNMGITNYPGNTLLLRDVEIAKNYLTEEELNILNRIVTAYLGVAEIQALNRIPMTMRDWMERLHQFLTMTGREVLAHAGQISHEAAMHKARVEYEKFCTARAQLPTAVEQHFVEAERRVQQNIPSRDRNKS